MWISKSTLSLNRYALNMYLGVSDYKRNNLQTVYVSLDIRLIADYLKGSVLDCDEISHFLNRKFEGQLMGSQEEMAQKISDHILQDPLVVSVKVHTEKPEMFKKAESTGFVLERFSLPV